MNRFLQVIALSILFLSVSFSDELVCDKKKVEQGSMPAAMDCLNVDIEIKDKKLNLLYNELIELSFK